MPQFNTDTFVSQVFWLIFSLSILYIVNSWFIFPRFYKIFADREHKIEHDKALHVEYQKQHLALEQKYQQLLSDFAVQISSINQHYKQNLQKFIAKKNEQLSADVLEIENEYFQKVKLLQADLKNFDASFSNEFLQIILTKFNAK